MVSQDNSLKRRILSDEYNALIFRMQKGNVHLVGGYVRDLLRGIYSRDRDFILSKNRESFLRDIKKILSGKAIQFKKGTTIRIAMRNGTTLDFSVMDGTLFEDLSKRDFTINAMAWSPEKGLIDLFHGVLDLNKLIIRSISKENIISDPLRMLRAYRFAAEIEGKIEIKTRNIIKMFSHAIKDISSERITLEMFHLLNSDHASKYLKSALDDGILSNIILLSNGELHANIKSITRSVKGIPDVFPDKIKVKLKNIFSQNLTYKGLLCLEILTKSGTKVDNPHPLLKLSKRISKRIQLVHKALAEFSVNKPDLFSIFMHAQEASIDALIISNRADLFREYYRFQKIWKAGLLSSEEIRQISGLDDGAQLGGIILRLKREQFERKIRTKAQAKKYLSICRQMPEG
jgi:tRNA nucleotidyltransferase/poly(A) polymerase